MRYYNSSVVLKLDVFSLFTIIFLEKIIEENKKEYRAYIEHSGAFINSSTNLEELKSIVNDYLYHFSKKIEKEISKNIDWLFICFYDKIKAYLIIYKGKIMKFMILLTLIFIMLFLIFMLYKKKVNKLQEQEVIENEVLKEEKFNNLGETIISKEEYILLLRKNIVDLTNIVKDIVEKDEDDNILYQNLIKALKILDEDDINTISDQYVSEIKDLVDKVEKYYDLI